MHPPYSNHLSALPSSQCTLWLKCTLIYPSATSMIQVQSHDVIALGSWECTGMHFSALGSWESTGMSESAHGYMRGHCTPIHPSAPPWSKCTLMHYRKKWSNAWYYDTELNGRRVVQETGKWIWKLINRRNYHMPYGVISGYGYMFMSLLQVQR